jgi:hypothetical protein
LTLSVYRRPTDIGTDLNPRYDSYATSNYVRNRAVFGPSVDDEHPTNVPLSGITDGSSNTIMGWAS